LKVFLAKNKKLVYFIIMIDNNDSLARTAHAFGMTDLEFEQRSQVEAELAAQQVIRRWQEEEEALAESFDALKLFDEEENPHLF
tara:strand:- start:1989 stop:2240 length:252 start_codon:yes stop_codon:yes gene_type:complete